VGDEDKKRKRLLDVLVFRTAEGPGAQRTRVDRQLAVFAAQFRRALFNSAEDASHVEVPGTLKTLQVALSWAAADSRPLLREPGSTWPILGLTVFPTNRERRNDLLLSVAPVPEQPDNCDDLRRKYFCDPTFHFSLQPVLLSLVPVGVEPQLLYAVPNSWFNSPDNSSPPPDEYCPLPILGQLVLGQSRLPSTAVTKPHTNVTRDSNSGTLPTFVDGQLLQAQELNQAFSYCNASLNNLSCTTPFADDKVLTTSDLAAAFTSAACQYPSAKERLNMWIQGEILTADSLTAAFTFLLGLATTKKGRQDGPLGSTPDLTPA
jgi:hypothetical protein